VGVTAERLLPAIRRPSAPGVHHRHYKGKAEAVGFLSFEDIEDRFEADWVVFSRKRKT
jgi:hypothetical protein